jgi:hypothetical protein
MKRGRGAAVAALLLIVGAAVVITVAPDRAPSHDMAQHMEPMGPLGPPVLDPGEEIAWVCPIHPDYTARVGGTCPRDGMPLVQANPYDPRDWHMRMETVPSAVRAGEPATLRFRISHPGTGEPARELLTVHDRRYHLFVVSQDMEHFEHVHPSQEADGSWSVGVTLPDEGYYKIFSDFVPYGGSAQFLARPLVTTGYDGDLMGDAARLVPDASSTLSSGDLTARVSHDPPAFVAGLYAHLRFDLTDTRTGRPITDLEPYLGSFGHIVIMSEDLVHYVHSHPLDVERSDDETGPVALMLPMGVDASRMRGGPTLTFEGLMPAPGLYRAWAEFQRDGMVHTFAHTFSVMEPSSR